MRLGGPVFQKHQRPDEWARAVRALGYRAAYCPVTPDADDATVRAYAEEARKADIVIAEVGAWSNPISPDEPTRRAAIEKCCRALDLADRIGARCCVNIAGSRGAQWDGPDPDNYSDDAFDLIVRTVRGIIDSVKPTRTFYTLETMPWAPPDSPESYLRLIEAVQRERFAVHLDPVNLVNSPRQFYHTGQLLRESFARLGSHIRSCHAKDIALSGKLTVHLEECRPGMGGLDYATYLGELARLDPDTPLMLEHLRTAEEYGAAAAHIRRVAELVGVKRQMTNGQSTNVEGMTNDQ